MAGLSKEKEEKEEKYWSNSRFFKDIDDFKGEVDRRNKSLAAYRP
jgi:hypothetical protein